LNEKKATRRWLVAPCVALLSGVRRAAGASRAAPRPAGDAAHGTAPVTRVRQPRTSPAPWIWAVNTPAQWSPSCWTAGSSADRLRLRLQPSAVQRPRAQETAGSERPFPRPYTGGGETEPRAGLSPFWGVCLV